MSDASPLPSSQPAAAIPAAPATAGDGRSRTSRENGKKGGRPRVDWNLVALAFQAQTGRVLWRKGLFYRFDKKTGAYATLTDHEMGAHVAHYLRQGGGGDALPGYTPSAQSALVGALRAGDGSPAAVDFSRMPPCWLSSGDTAPSWVAMKNCLLDIEAAARGTGDEIREHTDDLFTLRVLPYEWDPLAECPRFLRALEEILPSKDSRDMIQMMAGLLLVPDTTYNVAFLLVGEPGSGKSTLAKIIMAMLGDSNVCCVPMSMLDEKHTIYRLTQTLANWVDDSPIAMGVGRYQSTAGIEGRLKEITSGGLIHCEPKGCDPWSAPTTARCVFCMNPPLPAFTDRTDAVWDRLRLVSFSQRFRDTKNENRELAREIIETELQGIFTWAVRGLGMLRKCRGFPKLGEGRELLEKLRGELDLESQFLTETYVFDPHYVGTPTTEVFGKYSDWCKERNYLPKNDRNFREAVLRVFPGVEICRANVRFEGNDIVHRAMAYGGLCPLGSTAIGPETDIF